MTNFFALVFIIIILFYSINKDVYTFLIGITLFLNIGGYFDKTTLGLPGFFNFNDLILFIVFITFFVRHKIQINKNYKQLLLILLIFVLYQLSIAIFLKLEILDLMDLVRSIAGHKWRILSVFICIPTYYYIQRFSKEFYYFFLFTSATILSLYFLTLITPLNLIPIVTMSREFVNANRIWFNNPGYIYIFPIVLVVYLLLKPKIKYKNLLLFVGFGSFLSIILTLTRGTILFLLGNILISIILVKHIFNLSISKWIQRSVFAFAFLLITSGIIFPDVIDNIMETAKKSISELSGEISEGATQSRSEFEVPIMLKLINENTWLGTGMLEEYFSHYSEKTEIGVADVPLLGHIAMYGILGFTIYLLRYFKINTLIKSYYPLLKRNISHLNTYEILLLIWAISSFYANIFFKFFNFSSEIYNPDSYIIFGISIGIIFGLMNKLLIITNENRNYILQ